VIDAQLRVTKEAALAPLARRMPRGIDPLAITLISLVPGVGAALTAAAGEQVLAVGLWLTNRALDGLDGTLARQRGRQSDLGAYLDILVDFVVYAAVPIGIAVHADDQTVWIAAAGLLAMFYVNTISWTYLAALLERRGGSKTPEFTSVTMPPGLIEGAETIVLYAVMLAVPTWAATLFWGMAGAVAITVVQRVIWAVRNL
jgi:phosphatidylglycerophosphate synthase